MSIPPAVLEDVLSALEVRLGSTTRPQLAPGAVLPLPAGEVTLVYVVAGEITGDARAGIGCLVDLPAGQASGTAGDRTLLAGDAFVTMGREATVLTSVSGARVMTARIDIAPSSAAQTLPSTIFVSGFDRLEPAAAALAANLGPAEGAGELPHSGDPLICRMMVTTVLLSVIRAWAQAGCAPRGWPAQASDPFLDRVVSAIHAEPGREWSLDLLATIGAMSRTVFAERFRQTIGRSPATYVADVRMQRAKELLDAGRTVSDTSRELGYASDEGFSRAFRRHTGVVPSAWRSGRRTAIPA